ncbi:FAD-binding protein [Janibacter melonis]|uniref:L-aspartate oxidase n=1 Tax=Janibacter melonis TaxID=262209 RepID=A0A5P8FIJ9_9MICO|nr:FAD-binding protein [Janibacter melonis]QFQ29369.1 FAD-binding protein [Janibacter melonis]
MSACVVETDAPVVVGSGLAGLSVARHLGGPCIVVAPAGLGEGTASAWAQGGIAAAVGPGDDPQQHADDTARAGSFAGDTATIARMTQAAPALVAELVAAGVPFDRDASGELSLGREGGHGRHRVCHVGGDRTGAAVVDTLAPQVAATSDVAVVRGRALELLVDDDGVAGVLVLDPDGPLELRTRRVVLATGGGAALYRDTTNPLGSWGSGVVLAGRAGARLADLELVQFHPTSLDVGGGSGAPLPLVTEAVRGAGAHLLSDGRRFVDEVSPRDVVAAAVHRERVLGRQVALDCRHVPDLLEHFRGLAQRCADMGLDPARDLLPVRPAAHYQMGGVLTDARGRTDVPGLWACGEVACTGLHGANRLASNSLLEAGVMGTAVAQDAACWPGRTASWATDRVDPVPPERTTTLAPVDGRRGSPTSPEIASVEVRAVMSDLVGVVRDADGLAQAIGRLDDLPGDDALLGGLVARRALARRESLGAHLRADAPAPAVA